MVLYLIINSLHGPVVSIEDLLHVEVGCGVDGVQQCPLVAQRIVLSFQFACYGVERLHHNGSAYCLLTLVFLSVIPPWRDDLPVSHIRLRIANENHRKHIDILRVEGS